MDLSNPLRTIAPTVDADVLQVLARTHRPLSGATVASLSGRSYARTRTCLHRFVEHGLVSAQDAGSAVLYTLNRHHVLAGPVLAAVNSAAAVEALLVQRLAAWDPPAQAAVVFGSWARGEAGPDSDLDLLLVRDDAVDADGAWGAQVHEAGRAVELLTGNVVQFVQVTGSQLAAAIREDQPLLASLRQDGRVLVGPPLRELLAVGATA
ncbi:nucleotidyltransferase domain-containing protein [Kineococcus sp. SYSU DK003]|uniref:nucleotidyltransferase domain-containing protein n=1 Tax=Kineococcus sp. SYSU DK003 TaxID=3383124 RepID=UPI003D7D6BEF